MNKHAETNNDNNAVSTLFLFLYINEIGRHGSCHDNNSKCTENNQYDENNGKYIFQ